MQKFRQAPAKFRIEEQLSLCGQRLKADLLYQTVHVRDGGKVPVGIGTAGASFRPAQYRCNSGSWDHRLPDDVGSELAIREDDRHIVADVQIQLAFDPRNGGD